MLSTNSAGAVLRGHPVPPVGTANASSAVTPAAAAVQHNVSAVATVASKKEHENATAATVKHNVSAVATVASKNEHENAKAAAVKHNVSAVATVAPKKEHANAKAAAVKHNVSAVATVASKKEHEKAKDHTMNDHEMKYHKMAQVAAETPVASAVALPALNKEHEDVLAMDAKVVAAAHVALAVNLRAPKDLLPIGEGAYQDAKAVKQRTTDSRRHCEEGKWKDCFKEGGDLLDGHEYGNYRNEEPAVHISDGPEAVALTKQSIAARQSISSFLTAVGLAVVTIQL